MIFPYQHKKDAFSDIGTLAGKIADKTLEQLEREGVFVFPEIVKDAIEFIKRKPYGNNLLVKVKDAVKLVIDATPGYEPYNRQRIIEQNKKNTVRHAYFREYLALQRLCLEQEFVNAFLA